MKTNTVSVKVSASVETVWVTFMAKKDHSASIKETFELEHESPTELQTHGWAHDS